MKIKLLPLLLFLLTSKISSSQSQLWGVSEFGGAHGFGTIFMADSLGNNLHTVYSFDSINGTAPLGGLTYAGNGKLYGVTLLGGLHNSCVVFCYNAITGAYENIHDFADMPLLGDDAHSAMIQANNGKLYGLCNYGGANNLGVIFEIDTLTNSYTDVFDFTSLTGSVPWGSLIQASNGLLYGITNTGGVNNIGTIFSFDISTHAFVKLYDFINATGEPQYGYLALMQATNGKLYGMTQIGGATGNGVIYSFDIATNTYTDLHNFNGAQGVGPMGTLLQASSGKLYGMTEQGGTGNGVLFSYTISTNTFNDLLNFNGTQGGRPRRGMKQVGNFNLFGTTYQGGANNVGVAFRYNFATNTYTKLIDFDTVATGIYPDCDFIATPELLDCANDTTIYISTISCNGYTLGSQTYYGSGIYTQVLTNVSGCDSVVTLHLDFGTAPAVSVTSVTICAGLTATLTATGATSYTWSVGATSTGMNTANVSPTTTTTYTVSGTTATGCASAVATVIVNPVPTTPFIYSYSGGAFNFLCSGDSLTLYVYPTTLVTGADYFWAGSSGWSHYGPSWYINSLSPSMSGIYTVTATLNGCSSIDTFNLCISQTPTLYPVGLSQTICSGDTASFIPSIYPAIDLIYPNYTSLYWTMVSSSPSISGYSLPPGLQGSISQVLINSGTTIGTVTYTITPWHLNSLGCFGTGFYYQCSGTPQTFVVTVNPRPHVTLTSNFDTICSGSSAVLAASGAATYTWSAGAIPTGINTAIASPITTSTFSVTASYGCSDTATAIVTVNPAPSISVNSPSICTGTTALLIATGDTAYTWSTGATPVSAGYAIASPITNTTYSVSATTSNGCADTALSTVTVTPPLSLTINSDTICVGESATLIASGGSSYVWSAGVTTLGGDSASVAPVVTTTYTVSATNICGSDSAIAIVTVNPCTVGLNDNKDENNITIYPNPTTGEFQVTSSKYRVQSIKIYNLLGELVLSSSSPSGRLGGAVGIYFVEIKTEKGIVRKKVVKE